MEPGCKIYHRKFGYGTTLLYDGHLWLVQFTDGPRRVAEFTLVKASLMDKIKLAANAGLKHVQKT